MAQKHEFYHSSVYKLVLSFVNGIFLYVFLLVFLPFGVSNYDPNHEYTLEFLLEIGHFVPLVIFLTLFNEFAIKPIFKGRSSLKFIIGWTIWSFILLGSAVFLLYNFLGNWHDWRWSSFPGFVIDVSAVLLFPIAGTFFFFRYKKLQEEYDEVLTKAEGGSDLKEMIHFSGEGVKDNISISVQDFLFARMQIAKRNAMAAPLALAMVIDRQQLFVARNIKRRIAALQLPASLANQPPGGQLDRAVMLAVHGQKLSAIFFK